MNSENLYYVAVGLPEPWQSEATAIKQSLAELFGCKAALRSPAHITLQMPFHKKIEKESEICDKLSEFCNQCSPFSLELNGYGNFDTRVIYIDVSENQALRNLQSGLSFHLQKGLHLNQSTYRNQGFHPHVTLAFRDLKKGHFKSVWEEVNKREFHAKMEISQISLLKHLGSHWEILKSFPFQFSK